MGSKKGKSPKGTKSNKETPPPPAEEPLVEVVATPELPPGELPGPPPVVTLEFVYNKELTLEQLHQVLQLSVNLEEAARYLAGIMQLGDIVFDARNLILLEYCLGNLIFGKNAGLNLKQIHVIYDIGHMILDIIRDKKPFGDAERIFRNRLITLSMRTADKPEEPMFSALDLQKITPYFISTIFQHYCLYQYCFTKVHYNIRREDKVLIETAMIYPLSEAKSEEELIVEEAARKAAAEKAEANALAARIRSQKEIFAALEAEIALKAEEELKRKPLNLEEAIEMSCRDKVNEVKKALMEEFEYRQKCMIDRIFDMVGNEIDRGANKSITTTPPLSPKKETTAKKATTGKAEANATSSKKKGK